MSTDVRKEEAKDPVAGPHRAAGSDHEVEHFLSLLRRYGGAILAGVVVVVLLVVGLGTYRSFRSDAQDQATSELSRANTAQEFEKVLENFSDTSIAPVARLGLAASYFRDGKYDEAIQAYGEFLAAYPSHPMAGAALVARAQSVEAKGDTEGAITEFTAFIAAHPDNYLAPSAAMGKARCLAQAGRMEDARAAYEEVIAAFPDTIWAVRSESDLVWLRRILRAQR